MVRHESGRGTELSPGGMHEVEPPSGLLAEVTHRCPLHCVYCSNTLELRQRQDELGVADWLRLIGQAAELGVADMHFSGGEPLARTDLETLVASASDHGIRAHLVTSGIGLTTSRADALVAAGLTSVALSVQGHDAESANLIAATRRFDKKQQASRIVRDAGLPLNMNVVLHRLNLDDLDEIITLCADWGAQRLELANTQYYGWALANRTMLLPSSEQLRRAELVYVRRKTELADRMELIWVLPDYHQRFPQACMGGWARTWLTVAPDGRAYPCPAAADIDNLDFPSVREHELRWIWNRSPAFTAFRGTEWMPAPCRSCVRKEVDFGGCRCQAFALTGDAARTDPVCVYSPDHQLVQDALDRADRALVETEPDHAGRLRYRRLPIDVRTD
jgi:PqqA peptide cyclase